MLFIYVNNKRISDSLNKIYVDNVDEIYLRIFNIEFLYSNKQHQMAI